MSRQRGGRERREWNRRMKSAGDMEDLKYPSTSGKLPPRGMLGFGRKAALGPSARLR